MMSARSSGWSRVVSSNRPGPGAVAGQCCQALVLESPAAACQPMRCSANAGAPGAGSLAMLSARRPQIVIAPTVADCPSASSTRRIIGVPSMSTAPCTARPDAATSGSLLERSPESTTGGELPVPAVPRSWL